MEERLQKYLANCGIASRRKSEEYILQGKVKVNNKVVTELGLKIHPGEDTVEFEGETYPVVKVEISSTSHPFYTGKSKLVDTAGRVDKFMSRYGKAAKK